MVCGAQPRVANVPPLEAIAARRALRVGYLPDARPSAFFNQSGDLVGFDDFKNVQRVLEAFVARPAVVKGLNIPPRD